MFQLISDFDIIDISILDQNKNLEKNINLFKLI
jgi:hypothetical protein